MKSRQFCSVCKQWLEMEVVQTSDADEDDGVIWFRCPQCQGFLPKLSGADLSPDEPESTASDEASLVKDAKEASEADTMPWDSPAEMMAARDVDAGTGVQDPDTDLPDGAGPDDVGGVEVETPVLDEVPGEEPPPPSEPVHEYAAMLADNDPGTAVPYRPWESYDVGQCIIHLAWDDCGVVVAKEDLPGGRRVIKCYFEEAGIVRLIENDAR